MNEKIVCGYEDCVNYSGQNESKFCRKQCNILRKSGKIFCGLVVLLSIIYLVGVDTSATLFSMLIIPSVFALYLGGLYLLFRYLVLQPLNVLVAIIVILQVLQIWKK